MMFSLQRLSRNATHQQLKYSAMVDATPLKKEDNVLLVLMFYECWPPTHPREDNPLVLSNFFLTA